MMSVVILHTEFHRRHCTCKLCNAPNASGRSARQFSDKLTIRSNFIIEKSGQRRTSLFPERFSSYREWDVDSHETSDGEEVQTRMDICIELNKYV